jgi:transposase
MLGHKDRDQLEFFITGSLRQLIPDEHVLARVDRVLDLSWLREEVTDCYCLDDGRPGIAPEVAVRLMLAGLLTGIVHDRKLMREAQVNIAIRWFIGYGLREKLPHRRAARGGCAEREPERGGDRGREKRPAERKV